MSVPWPARYMPLIAVIAYRPVFLSYRIAYVCGENVSYRIVSLAGRVNVFRIWSGTVSKRRAQNPKILLWSLHCSRPTWVQHMSNSVPNMVRNGLEKEGAKSENFVVEPDLLTTNLGPTYGPERFIVSYRLVWPAVVYRIVIYRVSYLSEIIGIVSYPGLIVSYLIVDLQAM